MVNQNQHEIKINLPGLLRMLGENIYSEPDVAIREMIQNAHDTCIIRGTKDENFKNPYINIDFNRVQGTVTISDNGTGMTEDELHRNLATIGDSFTRVQKEELRGKDAHEAALLIGQFGIGLLSAFSISHKVEVISRSYQSSEGYRWICSGDIHYTVEPYKVPLPGTRVVLHLLKSKFEILNETRLRQAIKKYADFLSIPIHLKNKQANECNPPWEKNNETANLSKYIEERWNLYPVGMIPFNMPESRSSSNERLPNISGLLFIPMVSGAVAQGFGDLDIYISRMFIKTNDKDLLPKWANFVKGIINTPDLTPTISRSEIIVDDSYYRVQRCLEEVILNYLENLQKNDPQLLSDIVETFNSTIKLNALEDLEEPNDGRFFDRICDLVRVFTDRGFITIPEYLKLTNGKIYYFTERGSGTQQKVLFAQKGLPIIDANWGLEAKFLEKYAQRKGIEIQRVEAESGAIFTRPETIDEKWTLLEQAFSAKLNGQQAKAVEFEPYSVPAVWVSRPPNEIEDFVREIYESKFRTEVDADFVKRLFKKHAEQEDKILHLNINNPLIQKLRDMPRNDVFELAVVGINNNAHLFAQHVLSPENAEKLFASNNQAFLAMIEAFQDLDKEKQERTKVEIERNKLKQANSQLERVKAELENTLEAQPSQSIELAEHRSCFFAFDYKIEENHLLLKWLKEYFLKKGIKVMAPAEEMEHLDINKDIHQQIKKAHFCIAEISNNNQNVLYEIGLTHGMAKPLILLRREDSPNAVPFDIFSIYQAKYDVAKRGSDVRFTWLDDELEKAMNTISNMMPSFQNVPEWPGQ